MKGCRALTPAEARAIRKHLAPHHRAWFSIGLATGYRISEILGLTPADIGGKKHGEKYRVYVPKERMKGSTRGRYAFLDAQAVNDLKRHRATSARSRTTSNSSNAKLFPCCRKTAHQVIIAAARAAGIKDLKGIGTHSLRKTFAARAYRTLDKNISFVQSVMGHADMRNTIRYLRECETEYLWKRLQKPN
jgi:integrase